MNFSPDFAWFWQILTPDFAWFLTPFLPDFAWFSAFLSRGHPGHLAPNLFYALYYIFTWNNKKNDFWPKTKMCTAKIQDGVSFWPKIEISSFCLRMSKKSDPDEKVYFVQYQVWNILKNFFFHFWWPIFEKKNCFKKKIPKNLGRHIYFYFFLIFWSIWHGFNVLRPERA